MFAVVGGLLCPSPLSFEKPEGNGGARFCESEPRALCAKEMVLGLGRTLMVQCVLFVEMGSLGRKEGPLTPNDLVVLP